MSKKSTKQHFPYQCQTKANTIKRGKSIERNFYIDFTAKQGIEQSSEISNRGKANNENVSNENRYLNNANKTMGDEMDIRYRNFRNNRLNYKNYLLSTDSSLTSSLYSPSISTSSSSRSSSVKNRAQVPSLPENISQRKKNLKKTDNKKIHNKYQKDPPRTNYNVRSREMYLSENNYDYDSTLDYLISDYDDYQNYDYDYDYDSFHDIPQNNNRKGRIHFINGNSNLYNISEISELNSQSEIKSTRSHHRHQRQIQKQHNKHSLNHKLEKGPQNQAKTLRPKFCATEDLTESFLDDLTDHPRHKNEDEDYNEDIKRYNNRIKTEINRRPLKISSPIHIFANNTTIQRIKGKIPPSDVYMHVPTYDTQDTSSISQMPSDENDLTISAISFNNFGSPSPIKARNTHSNRPIHQVKSMNIPNNDDDDDEINTNVNQANNDYIKKIKSRNINYQQMINNQTQNQNEKQQLLVKRTKNESISKEQNVQPVNEANINPNRLTIITVTPKSQEISTKCSTNDQIQKSQNLTKNQTKKMIQSLFSNQEDETMKQNTKDKGSTIQVSKTPQAQNNINTTTNDQSKKYSTNPSVQNFIRQNNEIIEDLKQKRIECQELAEKVNLIPHLTSSSLTENSLKKEDEIKATKPQNSEIENLNNNSISNISAINKVSNLTTGSGRNSNQTSNANDLLSDSYDENLSTGQKTAPNNKSKVNNSNQVENSQDILFEEYNTTMSDHLYDPSNAAYEIALSEIREILDESSSRGESHKIPMEKDNNVKEDADNNSFSSLTNDDFNED